MDSVAVLRSYHCAASTIMYTHSLLEKPGVLVPLCNGGSKKSLVAHGLAVGGRFNLTSLARKGSFLQCVKAVETKLAAPSDVSSESTKQEPMKNKSMYNATFPSGIEALVLEVCDETEIAELKLKVGGFEMNLRRNLGATVATAPIISPLTPPHIPSQPMSQSALVSPPTLPSISTSETTVNSGKSPKLVSLEASGATGYVLVSSPTVGSFRRGRTVKGKKRPPVCKEGDYIKEGQVIGYVDQFGSELPVKSDVDGEILKLLYSEGEAVGYGDPLVAVLPSFHGIK